MVAEDLYRKVCPDTLFGEQPSKSDASAYSVNYRIADPSLTGQGLQGSP